MPVFQRAVGCGRGRKGGIDGGWQRTMKLLRLVPEQVTLQIPHPPSGRQRAFRKDSRRPGKQSNLFPVAKPRRGRVWKLAWNNSRSLARGRVYREWPRSFPEPGGRHIKQRV